MARPTSDSFLEQFQEINLLKYISSNVSVWYQTDSFLKRELVVDFGKFDLGYALA